MVTNNLSAIWQAGKFVLGMTAAHQQIPWLCHCKNQSNTDSKLWKVVLWNNMCMAVLIASVRGTESQRKSRKKSGNQ